MMKYCVRLAIVTVQIKSAYCFKDFLAHQNPSREARVDYKFNKID